MRYMYARFPEGKDRAVTFSYDDACRDDIRLADTLTSHGLKGTFNMNSLTSFAVSNHPSNEDIIEHILKPGHEIAVHGFMHRANGNLHTIDGIRDVLDCRLELERTFDTIIRGMAYPDTGVNYLSNGTTYSSVKNYLTELDIAYARTTGQDSSTFALPVDWHHWVPTAHHTNPEIFNMMDRFFSINLSAGAYQAICAPRLFYIWGHSYEFNQANNWDLLDKICEKISGHDNVWYATNIEIYKYMQAYLSLERSADGRLIYNPTLYTIWFVIDGKEYVIKPNETLKI